MEVVLQEGDPKREQPGSHPSSWLRQGKDHPWTEPLQTKRRGRGRLELSRGPLWEEEYGPTQRIERDRTLVIRRGMCHHRGQANSPNS